MNLKSPLNYAGSKTELMPQLIKYFPEKETVDTLYDVFAGGLSVSINSEYNKIISNDIIIPLISLYKEIQSLDYETLISNVLKHKIKKDDPEAYAEMRNNYNIDKKDPYLFFGLVCSCTNNLMRFNKSGGFNQTFGKRNISDNTINKLKDYYEVIKSKNIEFTNYDFLELFRVKYPKTTDFVYFDSPYNITESGYNSTWQEKMDKDLFNLMDKLNDDGIRFAYSGVSIHKNIDNPNMKYLSKYKVINLEQSYEKVAKIKGLKSQEILVVNY